MVDSVKMGGGRRGGGKRGGGGWGGGWDSGGWGGGGSGWSGAGGSWANSGWGGSRGGGGGQGRGRGGGRGKGGGAAVLPEDAFLEDSAVAARQAQLRAAYRPDPQTLHQKIAGSFGEAPELHSFGCVMLNKQFKTVTTRGALPDELPIRDFHEALIKTAATANCLTAADATLLAKNDNLKAGFVRVLSPGERVGVVFIDAFAEARRPGGADARNVAMVCTVGPQRKRYSSDEDFVNAVRSMAGNLGAACAEYAALGSKPPIEVLRVFPVSVIAKAKGGAGKCDKNVIAKAICQGLVDGSVAGEGKVPVFEFAFDAGGDLFGSAWRSIGGHMGAQQPVSVSPGYLKGEQPATTGGPPGAKVGFAELTNEGIEREAQLAVGINASIDWPLRLRALVTSMWF